MNDIMSKAVIIFVAVLLMVGLQLMGIAPAIAEEPIYEEFAGYIRSQNLKLLKRKYESNAFKTFVILKVQSEIPQDTIERLDNLFVELNCDQKYGRTINYQKTRHAIKCPYNDWQGFKTLLTMADLIISQQQVLIATYEDGSKREVPLKTYVHGFIVRYPWSYANEYQCNYNNVQCQERFYRNNKNGHFKFHVFSKRKYKVILDEADILQPAFRDDWGGTDAGYQEIEDIHLKVTLTDKPDYSHLECFENRYMCYHDPRFMKR